MEGINKKSQVSNLQPTNFNAPKSSNSKLVLSLLGVFVVLLVIGFFVYKNFPKNSTVVGDRPIPTQETTVVGDQPIPTQETTVMARYRLYQDEDTAISFQYPQSLFLLDRDEDGSKMLPNIFFQTYQYSNGYYRQGYCPVDCIRFSAFLRSGNVFPFDIPLFIEKNNPQFPIYDDLNYVYQDETGSKPFQINGMETVRYYAVRLTDSHAKAYARDKTTPVEYTLEDRVFIKDPNFNGRIIFIVYEERINQLPTSAQSLDVATIKSLFNQEKYSKFQDILASVKTLHVDKNQFTNQSSKELGVSFQIPKYWGRLVESVSGTRGTSEKFLFLSFKSPLFSWDDQWDDQSQIEFEADNSKTAGFVYEGSGHLYQYYGQPLDSACRKNAYFYPSGTYDTKITECNLRTLSSGMKVVVFKGTFAYAYDYPEGEIPPDKRQFVPFKGAILQTKSTKWPGMSIHFDGIKVTNATFDSLEKIFDKIIDSLSYSK